MQFGCNLTEFLGKHRGVICNQVWSSQNWAMPRKNSSQMIAYKTWSNPSNSMSTKWFKHPVTSMSMTPSRDIASPDLESATSAPKLRLNSFSRWIRTGPRQVSWEHKGVFWLTKLLNLKCVAWFKPPSTWTSFLGTRKALKIMMY